MAGAAADVHVMPEAVKNKPHPWILSTPESAVRSYLDWTSYAYRIGQSDAATATMGPSEGVRVDSYIQYNIEKSRLIDQTLQSVSLGTPTVGTTSTLVPTKEQWSYRYVSTQTAGKVEGGPYSASYEATYTVVKSGKNWVVDSVAAKALGEVK